MIKTYSLSRALDQLEYSSLEDFILSIFHYGDPPVPSTKLTKPQITHLLLGRFAGRNVYLDRTSKDDFFSEVGFALKSLRAGRKLDSSGLGVTQRYHLPQ